MSTQNTNGGKDWSDDPRLTAYALGELGDEDRAQLEAEIDGDAAALALVAELRAMGETLEGHFAAEQAPELSAGQRAVIEERMTGGGRELASVVPLQHSKSRRKYAVLAATLVAAGFGGWGVFDLIGGGSASKRSVEMGLALPGDSRVALKEEVFAPIGGGSASRAGSGEYSGSAGGNSIRDSRPVVNLRQTGRLSDLGYLGESESSTLSPEVIARLEAVGYSDGSSTSTSVEAKLGKHGGTYRGPGDSVPPAPGGTGSANWFLGRGELSSLGYSDVGGPAFGGQAQGETSSREGYDHISENDFKLAQTEPYSTFSIDVDTASYANSRRMIEDGHMPPPDAVRIEEFVNYFPYDYPAPEGEHPFSVNVEVGAAPWAPQHRLVRIGLQGRETLPADRKASNLVFLMDVSGSMNSADKLPLLKKALHMLVQELDERDTVSIVVYAGASGLALAPTTCDSSVNIHMALEGLRAGGSTNGGAGITLAYQVAAENFIEGGINRVILATDGDFNVGVSSNGDLVRLIEEKAKTGVFLSVLGFGRGNLQDSKMEQLADKGNGNYAYIDSVREARKVLVEEMGSTLETIAKDVKIQIEFNPAEVQAYRLIGYENRMLATQDFNDDKKDAGEIGAGHSVTALFEVVPVGVELDVPGIDPLRYQEPKNLTGEAFTGELMLLKLRYKQPDGDKSVLMTTPVVDEGATFDQLGDETRWAATVAAFGMILRDSEFKGTATLEDVSRWAIQSAVKDPGGYRAQFIGLVSKLR